jgi:hypothetical protein
MRLTRYEFSKPALSAAMQAITTTSASDTREQSMSDDLRLTSTRTTELAHLRVFVAKAP